MHTFRKGKSDITKVLFYKVMNKAVIHHLKELLTDIVGRLVLLLLCAEIQTSTMFSSVMQNPPPPPPTVSPGCYLEHLHRKSNMKSWLTGRKMDDVKGGFRIY